MDSSKKKNINPKATQQFLQNKKSAKSVEEMVNGILAGDRVMLSQAITLAESVLSEHQLKAQKVLEGCLPHSGKSLRVGVTGIPGVGKSTFIEAFGKYLVDKKKKVAVLAIDPSSSVSKGSILGDKTRMTYLSSSEGAFVRPSPAGKSLGGVARKTRESIILCEAAGYDTILIETVGVGQSEIAVHSMVDLFLLLLVPGAGDELQGIKKGIVEMADLLAVNKADGDAVATARRAKKEYQNALHLMPLKESGIIPKVLTCSALTGDGIDEIWNLLLDYEEVLKRNSFFEKRRQEQALYWLHEQINIGLKDAFFNNDKIKARLKLIEQDVLSGKTSSFSAADELLSLFFKK